MTKRELWLKLFEENQTALATAIHLCERFVTLESLEKNEEFIAQKIDSLYDEVPDELVKMVFPNEQVGA